MSTFGDFITLLRELSDMKKESQFAKKVGLSEHRLEQLEQGTIKPDDDDVAQLAKAFEMKKGALQRLATSPRSLPDSDDRARTKEIQDFMGALVNIVRDQMQHSPSHASRSARRAKA